MLLNVPDVARELNVSKACVYALVARGVLPHVRIGTGRGTIRVKPEDLQHFIDGQRRDQCAEPVPAPRTPLQHLRFRELPR